MDNRLDYVLDILKSFKGHAGRKGLVGGSLPRGASFTFFDDAVTHFKDKLGLELVLGDPNVIRWATPEQLANIKYNFSLDGEQLRNLGRVADTIDLVQNTYHVDKENFKTIAIHPLQSAHAAVHRKMDSVEDKGKWKLAIQPVTLHINYNSLRSDTIKGGIAMSANIEQVVLHEMGHVLLFQYESVNAIAPNTWVEPASSYMKGLDTHLANLRKDYIAQLKTKGEETNYSNLGKLDYKKEAPSVYALTDPHEFAAETFLAHHLGMELPKKSELAYKKLFKPYEKN